MKNLVFLTIGALLAASGSSMAADLALPPAAPVIVTPAAYDWTGAYVGVNAGYGWGTLNYDPTLDPNSDPAGSFSTSGWLGGLTAGYNFQLDNSLVVGVEGDIDAAGITGTGAAFDPTAGSPTVPSFSLNWLGTARGRIGFAADNYLIYATAGLAVGGVSGTLTNVDGGGDNRSASGTQWGWTVGAGVEAALTSNITVKAEYLYTDLGTANYTFTGGPFAPADDVATDSHPTASIVRVGLNYRF